MPNLDDELRDVPTADEKAVLDGGVETIARDTPYVPTPQNSPSSPLRWKNIRPYAMPAFQGVGIGLIATGVALFVDVLASRYFGSNTLLTRETPTALTLMYGAVLVASAEKKEDSERLRYAIRRGVQPLAFCGALMALNSIFGYFNIK